jgi:predicted nucleic acid-binding Zn ribbon protein
MLARVQSVWADAVGPTVAEQSQPRRERDGVVTVVCASSVWAQELDLMSSELLGAVRERLVAADGVGVPRELRFVSGR